MSCCGTHKNTMSLSLGIGNCMPVGVRYRCPYPSSVTSFSSPTGTSQPPCCVESPDGLNLHNVTRLWRMNHLVVPHVDAHVSTAGPNQVTALHGVAADRFPPADEGFSGTWQRYSGLLESPLNKSRAVEGVGSRGAPDVRATQLRQCGLNGFLSTGGSCACQGCGRKLCALCGWLGLPDSRWRCDELYGQSRRCCDGNRRKCVEVLAAIR